MMTTPHVIASYPRSGSTWLRFILTHLYYPGPDHDVNSVNKHIPAMEDWGGMVHSIPNPLFLKTHGLRSCQRVIHIHRHVGDALASEFYYKKKYDPEDRRTLTEFLFSDDFGSNWRKHADHYFPSFISLSYDEIGNPETIQKLTGMIDRTKYIEEVRKAIEKSSFDKMKVVEKKGFGIYPTGDPAIPFFRVGKSGQWKDWPSDLQKVLIQRNDIHLRVLGYAVE